MRAYKIIPSIKVKSANLSKEALKRLAWMDWYFSHKQNAELTCRHFGISKSVFYRWKTRFKKYDLTSLEFNTKLRRPHKLREMTTPSHVLKKIYEIRVHDLTKSKYEIHEELKRENIVVAHKVIQKVINRHLELQNTEHIKRVKISKSHKIVRTKADRALKDAGLGALVQIDTKHLYILGQRFYVFVAIDCKSRLGFVDCYHACSSQSAADFLDKVMNYFPFKIQAVNTDNGAEYLLHFHAKCEELGMSHYFNHPHTPKMNSRAERLIKTFEYEYIHFKDVLPEFEDVKRHCKEFNDFYNYKRFHHSLHYKTPFEYVTNYQLEKGGQPFSI